MVISLSIALWIAGVTASPGEVDWAAGAGSQRVAAGEAPLAEPSPRGVAPLERGAPPPPVAEPALPAEGLSVFDGPTPPDEPHAMPSGGEEPLASRPTSSSGGVPWVSRPLGAGPERPAPEPPEPPDPRTRRVVHLDILVGPALRIRPADTTMTFGASVGPMQGLSATFHTSFMLVTDRDFVQVVDVPIGFGALLRGRMRNEPLYGSVGVSAGIMVHRASSEEQGTTIHRVDPDFRVPIQGSWAISKPVGASLAIVPAFSVRSRTYERRGAEVWNRHSFRISLMLGLYWDIMAGRAKLRWPNRRDGER